MIWLRRLLLLPGLAGMVLILGYFFGYEALTSGGYGTGAVLAVAAGITLLIVLRLFAAVALGMSLFLGLLALIGITLAASYFLFEQAQDRWFNNQNELPIQVPQDQRDQQYLKALGITPGEWPPLDWWQHSQYQANSGLASQQLTPNQLGKPFPALSAEEVWLNWLGQFMMLCLSLLVGIWFGSVRRSSSP